METVDTTLSGCQPRRDGRPPAESAPGSAAGLSAGAAPWYSTHNRAQDSTAPTTVRVYEDTLTVHTDTGVTLSKRGGGPRGKVTSLSYASAARLRRTCLTQYVAGWNPYAITFTIHRKADVEDYRAVFDRFRHRVKRAGVPMIYRHEMQRRGVPHLHVIAWLDPSRAAADEYVDGDWGKHSLYRTVLGGWAGLAQTWLECSGEQEDIAARYHAVQGRVLDQQDRWSVYIALHSGKDNQQGYPGRQWGVINRTRLSERPHVELALTIREGIILRRRLRKWIIADRRSQAIARGLPPKALLRRRVSTGLWYSRITRGVGKGVPEQLVRGLGSHGAAKEVHGAAV